MADRLFGGRAIEPSRRPSGSAASTALPTTYPVPGPSARDCGGPDGGAEVTVTKVLGVPGSQPSPARRKSPFEEPLWTRRCTGNAPARRFAGKGRKVGAQAADWWGELLCPTGLVQRLSTRVGPGRGRA